MLSLAAALLPSISLWPDGLRASVVAMLASPQRLFHTSALGCTLSAPNHGPKAQR